VPQLENILDFLGHEKPTPKVDFSGSEVVGSLVIPGPEK
jgi:hypothetical protein